MHTPENRSILRIRELIREALDKFNTPLGDRDPRAFEFAIHRIDVAIAEHTWCETVCHGDEEGMLDLPTREARFEERARGVQS